MGTHYANLTVEMDLPGEVQPSHNEFQTKSLFGQMENFTLNKDGILVHHYRVCNGLTYETLFDKDIILPLYRNIYFYQFSKRFWYEYIAIFNHGNCVRIDIHNVGKQPAQYPFGYENRS